jgi:phage recombination protein Bet
VNGSAVARTQTSAVDPAIGEAIEVYSRLNALRAAIAPDLNDAELQLFAMVAHRSGLDPFNREIHAVKRQGKVTFQTGIDGFRSRAEDTGEYDHQDEPVFGEWVDKPFPHPVSATVTIHRWRGDRLVSQSATARWDSYYPGDSQGFQWKRMPDVMLAKCAEAQAFRKLFPRKLSGVYISEEMQQADAAEQATPVSAPSQRDRVAAQRAEIEARTTSAPAAGSAAPVAVQGAEAPQPPTPAPAAEPSPEPSPSGEAQADVVEGVAVEVAPVQCDGFSEDLGRCRLFADHEGPHKNDKGVWPR